MADLTEKYRLIWSVDSSIIQNDYERDCSGSITIIINSGDIDFIQSDVYQDILDKITNEGLITDPSLNE